MGTRHDQRHAADICREHGWSTGTRLVGSDGLGTTVIEITALGNQVMLARMVSQNGQAAAYNRDRSWRLSNRDWREAACEWSSPNPWGALHALLSRS